jgi:aspartate 1-decarboxylase
MERRDDAGADYPGSRGRGEAHAIIERRWEDHATQDAERQDPPGDGDRRRPQLRRSISIDPILLKAADIVANEQVSVYNLMNGARFETYAIEGTEGQVCLNGAAARLAQVGDLVIIASYVDVEDKEIDEHQPVVVQVDEGNRPTG